MQYTCIKHAIHSVGKQTSHCKHDAGGLERQQQKTALFSNILTRHGRLKYVETVQAEEGGAPPRSFALLIDSFFQSAWPEFPSRHFFCVSGRYVLSVKHACLVLPVSEVFGFLAVIYGLVSPTVLMRLLVSLLLTFFSVTVTADLL